MSRKQTIMKIGSSRMLIGTYLATIARIGAMMSVGRSMRATKEAMMRFLSSFLSVNKPDEVLREVMLYYSLLRGFDWVVIEFYSINLPVM